MASEEADHDIELIKKKFDPDCPGCKAEQYRDSQRGFPIRDILRVWFIVLCNGKFVCLFSFSFLFVFVCVCVLFCFIPFGRRVVILIASVKLSLLCGFIKL